jgi:hypothetical protein
LQERGQDQVDFQLHQWIGRYCDALPSRRRERYCVHDDAHRETGISGIIGSSGRIGRAGACILRRLPPECSRIGDSLVYRPDGLAGVQGLDWPGRAQSGTSRSPIEYTP